MVGKMKLKKVAIVFILTLFALILSGTFNVSNAAQGSKYLGIRSLRASGYGYKAFEKNVWKIVEYESNQTTYNYDNTIYCLKAGPGFGSSSFGSGTPEVRHYTRYFNMKDPSSIESPYNIALIDVNSTKYKSLLWLLENVYVAPSQNPVGNEKQEAEEFKKQLLNAAGVEEGLLTDDDIDVVQQMAVWHFTNEGDSSYDAGTSGNFDLHVTVNPGSDNNYESLSDDFYFENGWDRAIAAQKLYRYLVSTATEKAADYEVTTASQPYELADTTKKLTTQGNNYVIGPFRINQISDTTGTITGTFKNGNGETLNPTFQDERGQTISSLEKTIGKDFYIVLPNTTNVEKITFTISGSYYETTITYWSVEGAPAEDQPVAIVERQKKEYSDSVEFTQEKEKIFDLALRKYIVSINGVQPTVNREPQISKETLNNLKDGKTTTAEKIHTKTPLTVKTGDNVIYTIRVYNEGDVDAIVTEITDYLPEGLKLKEDSQVNTTNGWSSTSENIIKIHLVGF